MTTSSRRPALTRIDAMTSLACLVGIDIRHGYSLPGDVFDAYLSAVSAVTYPTMANIERKFDAFDVVSARVKVSVDSLQDWADRWSDQLVDQDHLAVSGLGVVEGELVRS